MKIIYYDKKGIYQYDDNRLVYFDETLKINNIEKEKLELIKLDDIAVMCTTSGTTGFPKIAMLSHKNLSFMSRSLKKPTQNLKRMNLCHFYHCPV